MATRRSARTPAVRALVAVLALVAGGCAGTATPDSGTTMPETGPTTTAPPGSSAGSATARERSTTVRLTAIGDSLTGSDGDLAGDDFGPGTWLPHVLGAGEDGSSVEWVGGWAVPGATTAVMRAQAEPRPDADVLVVLAGTNDIALGVPAEEIAANIEAIVATVGAPRVIVASVPPIEWAPDLAPRHNAALEALARGHGWEFADVAAGLRRGDGWVPGMSDDGVHPTEAGYAVLGRALREALLR
ncbi:SGNH/GDSL hydrolase family protein [Georgenia muralis]|uniref:Lysophospholipase L1-like esterase n=1 Tax=Georgenia muralis TaxID=154117 RepID=A0A3N4ZK58_9MICO|nr:SGNH/GDSL hydrolase family protein [Georgenia muralis]RPF26208.1 lysophospholipase L1-like esterase [Georgenia muralis]